MEQAQRSISEIETKLNNLLDKLNKTENKADLTDESLSLIEEAFLTLEIALKNLEGQDEEDNFTLESNLYDEVSSRINEYRQLFKSIRTGAMGSKSQCIEDICRFCVIHNKTFDQVLEVTSYYLQNTQYACNADRFIYHIDSISGKEKSRIETIFEEYENKESTWKTI